MTSRFKKYKNTILNEEIKNVFSILSYNKKTAGYLVFSINLCNFATIKNE